MAGLRETTAALARYRRQFEKVIAATAQTENLNRHVPADSGRFRTISDFGSNPGNLIMRAHVPATLPAGAPLVVVLHGCTQSAEGYDLGAGWSTLADRHGFALLLPEQQRANNPNLCFNWFLPQDITRGQGETLSIRQMIDWLVSNEAIDPARIFVTGLSAGGAMAAVMLATYPDVFAGGAIIAGLPYGVAGNVQEALGSMFEGKTMPAQSWGELVRAASPHRGPWPKISIWHGSADRTVQPSNADELAQQWTNVHGLPETASFEERVNGYPRRVWRDAAGNAVVESYTITGMAHGAPIAAGAGAEQAGAAGPFILESGISSSYRIASFWGLIPAQSSRAAHPSAVRLPQTEPLTHVNGAAAPRPVGRAGALPRAPGLSRPGRREFDPQSVIAKALRSAGLLKR